MPDHQHSSRIKPTLRRALHQKLIRAAHVGKRIRPRSAGVSYTPVFKVRRSHTLRRESGAQMPSMLKIVSGAPESTVNIDDERKRRLRFRQAQIEKLILIRTISHSRIGSRRRQREDGIRHTRKVNRSFVPQRLDRVQIRRAHRRNHPADHAHDRQNRSRHNQNHRRNNQPDVARLGVARHRAIERQPPY